MARYSKKSPNQVLIKNKKLICPICENDHFIETRAQLNTRAMSFLDLDWANKQGTCYVCSDCTYIFWFRG